MPTVHVGGSGGSGGHGHSVSPTPTEQRVVVHPEVPQDTRNSIEDMEIDQLTVEREVRTVQGVSTLCSVISIQNVSWYSEWERWQATKLLHVAIDVYEEQSSCKSLPSA